MTVRITNSRQQNRRDRGRRAGSGGWWCVIGGTRAGDNTFKRLKLTRFKGVDVGRRREFRHVARRLGAFVARSSRGGRRGQRHRQCGRGGVGRGGGNGGGGVVHECKRNMWRTRRREQLRRRGRTRGPRRGRGGRGGEGEISLHARQFERRERIPMQRRRERFVEQHVVLQRARSHLSRCVGEK